VNPLCYEPAFQAGYAAYRHTACLPLEKQWLIVLACHKLAWGHDWDNFLRGWGIARNERN
jgi:hypothetical protein